MKIKFQKLLSLVLTFILTFSTYSVAFAADDIPEGYTPVYTAEDLDNIRNNLSGKYILMNDIELSAYENWEPIGTKENPFTGEFDGNSFTIKNISITKIEGITPAVGLFGTVSNSRIEDITVIGQININNDNGIRAGLICGEANNSVITECITYGRINVTTKAGVWVGGITGFLSVYSDTDEFKECKVEFCQNNALVTANGNCSYDVIGINFFVGGVVGLSDGAVSKCSNHGDITAIGKNGGYDYFYTLAGGICGNSSGELNNCYNVGTISSTGTKYVFAGGISGHWYQIGDIYNCYNIGQVKAEVKYAADDYAFSEAGGIIGEIEPLWIFDSEESSESTVSVRNCYYLDNVEKAFGDCAPENQINVKSLTNEDISKQTSYEGFDFENVWEMSDEEERPVLDFEKNSQSSATPYVSLIDAKIVKVPLKNRISFKQYPKSPEGIKIELTYSDGTIVTEEVLINGDRYYVNGELLEEAGGTTEVIYGITSAGYFMNEGKIYLSYKYLAFPPIFNFLLQLF